MQNHTDLGSKSGLDHTDHIDPGRQHDPDYPHHTDLDLYGPRKAK